MGGSITWQAEELFPGQDERRGEPNHVAGEARGRWRQDRHPLLPHERGNGEMRQVERVAAQVEARQRLPQDLLDPGIEAAVLPPGVQHRRVVDRTVPIIGAPRVGLCEETAAGQSLPDLDVRAPIRDAAAMVTKAGIPLVEVHITNPHAREEFRHRSVISAIASGVIAGFGFDSYVLALSAIERGAAGRSAWKL